jgi:NADH-quinone oxidoreductase subunit E
MLQGCDALLHHLCDALKVKPGGTTTDQKITLEVAECIGACEGAPALMVNDEHVMNVSSENVGQVVAQLR